MKIKQNRSRGLIYIGADHAGFDLKQAIKKMLDKKEIKYVDMNEKKVEGDDYPDVAYLVANAVSKDKTNKLRGILVCGSGVGMCIVANKVRGIRAATVYDKYSAVMSRKDNDTNVLCLRSRNMSQSRNLKFVKFWLNTYFSNAERHRRRIRKIE